jgi:hypothetical protein
MAGCEYAKIPIYDSMIRRHEMPLYRSDTPVKSHQTTCITVMLDKIRL